MEVSGKVCRRRFLATLSAFACTKGPFGMAQQRNVHAPASLRAAGEASRECRGIRSSWQDRMISASMFQSSRAEPSRAGPSRPTRRQRRCITLTIGNTVRQRRGAQAVVPAAASVRYCRAKLKCACEQSKALSRRPARAVGSCTRQLHAALRASSPKCGNRMAKTSSPCPGQM